MAQTPTQHRHIVRKGAEDEESSMVRRREFSKKFCLFIRKMKSFRKWMLKDFRKIPAELQHCAAKTEIFSISARSRAAEASFSFLVGAPKLLWEQSTKRLKTHFGRCTTKDNCYHYTIVTAELVWLKPKISPA